MKAEILPILIIDDDAFQRRVIRIKLQTRGYEVNEAKDGVEAIGFLTQQSYSMVLLDIVMPQLNGWEVLDQIRSQYSAQELPVIMMTAKDNSYDPEAARERGANDYLTKPIDYKALDERIDAYINGEQEHETPNQAAASSDAVQNQESQQPPNAALSLLDGVVRNVPGVVFRAVGDADHNVHLSYQSDGLQDFMGHSWESVQEIIASTNNVNRRELNRQFRSHGADLKRIYVQFPITTPAGKSGWVECRATPHRLPSGETVWDALLLDISLQKELELSSARAAATSSAMLLPLIELYRRFRHAVSEGTSVSSLDERIADLEQRLGYEVAEAAKADEIADTTYRDEQGFIHQCSQCRKVRNLKGDGRWEVVEEWTRKMPLKASHTLCDSCAEVDTFAPAD